MIDWAGVELPVPAPGLPLAMPDADGVEEIRESLVTAGARRRAGRLRRGRAVIAL